MSDPVSRATTISREVELPCEYGGPCEWQNEDSEDGESFVTFCATCFRCRDLLKDEMAADLFRQSTNDTLTSATAGDIVVSCPPTEAHAPFKPSATSLLLPIGRG